MDKKIMLQKMGQELEYWKGEPQAALMEEVRRYHSKGGRPKSLTVRVKRTGGDPDVEPGLTDELVFWVRGLVGSLMNAIEDYTLAGKSRPDILVLTVRPGDRWRSRYIPPKQVEEEAATSELGGDYSDGLPWHYGDDRLAELYPEIFRRRPA